jgi:phosphoribosylformimino-5-aminoimidazole carboxamide ribotide isomerase
VILLPAIDLKGGACVRLVRGDMASATQFHHDPPAQACDFAAAGFTWLHVIDLDGAFARASVNGDAVRAIRRNVPQMTIELGGGIRDRGAIDAWLDLGINRVVLGTAALRDPVLVRMAARDNPGRIVVGIDGRNGKVAVEGWAEQSEIGIVELGLRFADAGVAAIVVTDIARDGMMSGIDADAIAAFAQAVGIPVIASGGVASLADIGALAAHEKDGIVGAIIGRALYDGSLNPKAALALVGGAPEC